MKLGNDVFTATADSFIYVPRGTPHAFGNTSTEPARMLMMVTPGGMQGYFEQLSPLLSGPPKEAEIAQVLAQYSAECATLGRSLRSRRVRSASPNLRPGVHSPGLAPIEEDRDEQATAEARTRGTPATA